MKDKVNKNDFEEKVILHSLGLLDKSKEDSLDLIIDNSSETERELLKEFYNLSSLFSKILPVREMDISNSSKIKDKLFEKIDSQSKSIHQKNKTGFEFIFSDPADWIKHPQINGIEVKTLSVNEDKGYLMILMKAAAGAEYPSHHHNGAEECYVIEGDLYVEGKYLGPGDFHHAEGGSDHEPLRTKNGCTLLLVVDPKDY